MNTTLVLALAAVALAAAGLFALLPHRHGTLKPRQVQLVGWTLALLGIAGLLGVMSPPSGLLLRGFFYLFAAGAIGGAILMVTSTNPVYSALWFAAVILSTAGLFLEAGAQFLAAVTVIVYAGAIIVTFLFVIMLAQSEGEALYDRSARSPGPASFTCFLLLGALTYTLVGTSLTSGAGLSSASRAGVPIVPTSRVKEFVSANTPAANTDIRLQLTAVDDVLDKAVTPTGTLPVPVNDKARVPHVAGLGATLFIDHLVSIQLIGVILFVALIGAVAIATPRMPARFTSGHSASTTTAATTTASGGVR